MYAVVGCGECGALWIVEGRPETTGCPRCGKRHDFDRLRRFVETDEEDRARQARAALLADRSGHRDAFEGVGSFAELEDVLDEVGVSDEEYLGGSGIDVEAVEAAGEDAATGPHGGSNSQRSVVEAALGELEAPSERDVLDYAEERGVPPEATSQLLERMVAAGEASEHRGHYRLL